MRWALLLSIIIWSLVLFAIFKKPKMEVQSETKNDTIWISNAAKIVDTDHLKEPLLLMKIY